MRSGLRGFDIAMQPKGRSVRSGSAVSVGSARPGVPAVRWLGAHAVAAVLLGVARVASAEVDLPPPAPFEPVTVVSSESDVAVGVWGRRYVFERGPFPVSITSQGLELLAAAPEYEIALAGDEASAPSFGPARVVGRSLRHVELRSSASLLGLEVEAHTRVEYDGMISVRFELEPVSRVVLERFGYAFPLRSEQLEWFNHHVPYDYAVQNVDKQALVEAAGPIAAGASRFEFAPTFFVGGRTVGLELWWESNRGWSRRWGQLPISLERESDVTRLGVRPISARRRMGPDRPAAFEVAVFPTPLRPEPRRWRSRRFVFHTAVDAMTRRPDLRYVWIAFPKHFDAIYHGLPASKDSRRQRDLRAQLAENDIAYIPYAKLTASPSGHPLTIENVEAWAANTRPFRFPPPDERELLLANSTWESGEVYGYPVCTDRADYLDFMLEASVDTLVLEQTDGLYYDFGSITRMCERAARKPPIRNGARARTGEEVWHYFGLRRFYKRLFEEMSLRPPRQPLTIHTHGQPRALAAWADYVFVGEALNVVFRDGATWDHVREHPDQYVPDYRALPEGWLDAMVFPRVGGITSVIPELKYAHDPEDPGRVARYQRAFLAWVLVNDVHIWHGNADFPKLAAVYRALDRFGSLDDARLLPWWRHGSLLEGADDLHVSAYVRNGVAMLVVANLGDIRVKGAWPVDSNGLGIRPVARVRDLERDGVGEWRELRDGRLDVDIDVGDFRLLVVAP